MYLEEQHQKAAAGKVVRPADDPVVSVALVAERNPLLRAALRSHLVGAGAAVAVVDVVVVVAAAARVAALPDHVEVFPRGEDLFRDAPQKVRHVAVVLLASTVAVSLVAAAVAAAAVGAIGFGFGVAGSVLAQGVAAVPVPARTNWKVCFRRMASVSYLDIESNTRISLAAVNPEQHTLCIQKNKNTMPQRGIDFQTPPAIAHPTTYDHTTINTAAEKKTRRQ